MFQKKQVVMWQHQQITVVMVMLLRLRLPARRGWGAHSLRLGALWLPRFCPCGVDRQFLAMTTQCTSTRNLGAGSTHRTQTLASQMQPLPHLQRWRPRLIVEPMHQRQRQRKSLTL